MTSISSSQRSLIKEKPYIDPERMGVTGGSYGGYMTLWVIGHTHQFRAAAAQRVVSNFISMWGSSDMNWRFTALVGDAAPIDDLETAWFEKLKGARRWMRILQPYGPIHTTWIENFIGFADEITTVSTQLRQKFGRGIIIPHGKDTEQFDPAKYDRNKLRKELQFDGYKIIMFLGTVRPHKGLEHIIQALNLLDRDDIRLIIIGAGTEPKYEKMLKEISKDKVILKEKIPFNNIPQYLHAADIVVLPQKKTIQSYGQIPAKLFDAMAMAKPIIAADVSDLQMILNGCGIIVKPGNIAELSEKITWVFENYPEAEKMGQRAREKCIAEYSWDVMEQRLVSIFEKYG